MYTVDHPYAPAWRLTLGQKGWKLSWLGFSDTEKDEKLWIALSPYTQPQAILLSGACGGSIVMTAP